MRRRLDKEAWPSVKIIFGPFNKWALQSLVAYYQTRPCFYQHLCVQVFLLGSTIPARAVCARDWKDDTYEHGSHTVLLYPILQIQLQIHKEGGRERERERLAKTWVN